MLSFFEGVYVADLVSFLCGVFFFERVVYVVHLVRFLCCVFLGGFCIAHFLIFCVVRFFWGGGLCCSYC